MPISTTSAPMQRAIEDNEHDVFAVRGRQLGVRRLAGQRVGRGLVHVRRGLLGRHLEHHDHHGGIQWDDRASLHHTGDGNGVLDGLADEAWPLALRAAFNALDKNKTDGLLDVAEFCSGLDMNTLPFWQRVFDAAKIKYNKMMLEQMMD